MFYTFYLQTEEEFYEFKKYILYELGSLFAKISIYEDSQHQLDIGCEAFNVRIADNSSGIQFIGEDYGLKLNFLLWFDLYYSEDRSTDQMMMKFIGEIIKKNKGQCIMLHNGDRPILKRDEEQVVVVSSKVTSTPFYCMDIKYIEEEIEQK